jgi:hypothetical protein
MWPETRSRMRVGIHDERPIGAEKPLFTAFLALTALLTTTGRCRARAASEAARQTTDFTWKIKSVSLRRQTRSKQERQKYPQNRAKVAILVTSERPARRPASLAWNSPNYERIHRLESFGLGTRGARPDLRPEACGGAARDGYQGGHPETHAVAGQAVVGGQGPEPGCWECAAMTSKKRGRYSALAEVAWASFPDEVDRDSPGQ